MIKVLKTFPIGRNEYFPESVIIAVEVMEQAAEERLVVSVPLDMSFLLLEVEAIHCDNGAQLD